MSQDTNHEFWDAFGAGPATKPAKIFTWEGYFEELRAAGISTDSAYRESDDKAAPIAPAGWGGSPLRSFLVKKLRIEHIQRSLAAALRFSERYGMSEEQLIEFLTRPNAGNVANIEPERVSPDVPFTVVSAEGVASLNDTFLAALSAEPSEQIAELQKVADEASAAIAEFTREQMKPRPRGIELLAERLGIELDNKSETTELGDAVSQASAEALEQARQKQAFDAICSDEVIPFRVVPYPLPVEQIGSGELPPTPPKMMRPGGDQ